VLYIDRHLVHEVTSPQAYEGLRQAGRKVWRVSSIVATADHNTPTTGWELGYDGITDPISKEQITTLDDNMRRIRRGGVFPVPVQAPGHRARDRPGAGRHAARHDGGLRRLAHLYPRRLRCLAHGIGTSEVEHVMATQTLLAKKAKNMLVRVEGKLPLGCTAKDIVLAIIGRIGTAGGTGYTIEFGGSAIRSTSAWKAA
jgi:3-isopropylmalate/(R)-2-methylmalate dehydratase large subunit